MTTRPAPPPAAATLRFVVQRAAADRALLGPAWLLVLAATMLLAASVLQAEVARRDGLVRALRAVPATELAVTVHATVERDRLAADTGRIEDALRAATVGFGPGGSPVTSIARSDSWALSGQETVRDLTIFADVEAVTTGATLATGRWPEAGRIRMEAVVTEEAAAALRVGEPGEGLELASRRDGRVQTVVIVGIIRLVDAGDARWAGEPLLATGTDEGPSFRTLGPVLITREDLLGRIAGRSLAVSSTAVPDPAAIEAEALAPTAARVDALQAGLADALGTSSLRVETGLPAALRGIDVSLLAGGAGILLLDVQLAILAGYGLLLIGGLLLDERRAETALFRSRGADGLALTRWAVLEGVLVVASAAVVGLVLAYALVTAGPRFGVLGDEATPAPRLDTTAILVTVVAAVAALVGFLLPTITSLGPLAAARRAIGRQGPRGLAQRTGIDLALVALAVLALWQLREYGAPLTRDLRGTLGADPLLVAAPAVAMLAGAVVALRIVPLAASGVDRLVRPARGLMLPLGARQLARRPGRYARTTLLLVLAGAIHVFGVAYGATWSAAQGDQVDQEVGADLRVVVADPRVEPWLADAAIGSADGVDRRTPVRDEAFDLGPGGRGTLLAVRPEDADAIRVRADRATIPVADAFAGLVAARPDARGVALPEGTAAVRVTVRTELGPWITDEQPVPIDPAYPGLSVGAVVRDARGLVARFTTARVALEPVARSLVIPLRAEGADAAGLAPAGPLELLAIEVVLRLPDAMAAIGTVEVDGVATTPDAAAGADAPGWAPVGGFPGPGATGITRQPEDGDPAPVAAAAPGRVSFAGDAAVTGPSAVAFAFRAPGLERVDPLVVPALTDRRLQASQGTVEGEVATVSERFGDPRRLVVTGTLAGFPTIPPDRPFAVVDLATLALSDYLAHGRVLRPETWWASLAAGADAAAVAAAVAAGPVPAEVATRQALLDARLGDPVTRAVLAALGLGSLAALVFAAIGFLVTAIVGTRERLPDLAILGALGAGRPKLATWLSVEQGILLAVGLTLGAGLGAVLAWVVLPSVTLGPSAAVVDPPARVVVPADSLALLAGLGLALLAVTALMLARAVGRSDLPAVLRAADR